MKLKVVAVILGSLSVGFFAGVVIGLVYLGLNHVVLIGNDSVTIIGTFIVVLGWLLFLLTCVIDAHSDLHDEEVSIW